MSHIHSTAIVADGATIDPTATIGPFCVIGARVTLGAGVCLHANVTIDGETRIGDNTKIFPYAAIGTIPQDLKYNGEPAQLIIGSNNRIREHVTINIGTQGGGMITCIGDGNLLMIGTHIAHDCKLGDGNILANNVNLAGHVIIGNNAVIGGLSGVHQFVRIGDMAMIGVLSGVTRDVPPFCTCMGNRAIFEGLNLVGLRRAKFPKGEIRDLREMVNGTFERNGNSDGVDSPSSESLREFLQSQNAPAGSLADRFLQFVLSKSKRGLIKKV
ncbi:MAG: acyl-ACP--UDP-N-acetylglucosamine O-acyltransferase [Pseudomonadota bacterium]